MVMRVVSFSGPALPNAVTGRATIQGHSSMLHLPSDGGLPASLEHSETTKHPLDVQSAAQRRLHAPFAEPRAKVIDALLGDPLGRWAKRCEKLGMCGVSPRVYVERGRVPVVVPGRCRDRMCPCCQAYRARAVTGRVLEMLRDADAVRMVTLTVPATKASLSETVDRLWSSFRELRRRRSWTDHVRGGCAVMEVTRGTRGDHWHVHIHALVEGRFWAQREVAAEWSSVVGSACIVDIRAVQHRVRTARYVAKYAAKGVDVSRWTPEQIREYAADMHRRRLLTTFGRWHKCRTDVEDESVEARSLPEVQVGWCTVEAAMSSMGDDASTLAVLLSRASWTWRVLLSDRVGSAAESEVDLTRPEVEHLTELLLHAAGRWPSPEDDAGRKPGIRATVERQGWLFAGGHHR